MARKDNKGRNLKTGEYQRPDGRYEYRYKDEITGKRNSVYAADLASLREMEKKINKDMDDLLITDSSVKKLTVNTLFERYKATMMLWIPAPSTCMIRITYSVRGMVEIISTIRIMIISTVPPR